MNLFSPDDIGAILLSLKVALLATIATLPVALALSYALARGRFPGRSLIDAVVHIPLVLPPVATGYILLALFGRAGPIGALLAKVGIVLAFNWTGAALAGGVMALPLMVRPIRLSIETIDNEVEDAARTLGASWFDRFWRVILPLAAPGLISGAVIGFARALGEFGATITFVAAIPGETLTLPSDIYLATQSPGEETRTLMLCGVSLVIALTAILASDRISARITARARAA
jgi:molybdate transport system permease protein